MTSYDLIQPNLSEGDSEAKVMQIQRYLYQLVEQLNWALNSLDGIATTEVKQNTAEELFVEIKPMLDRLYASKKDIDDLGLRVVNGKLCVVREVT